MREAVLARLQQERTLYDELLARALRLAQSTLEELPTQQAFHVEGAASLLDDDAHDGVSLATLRALLEMMEEKERMVHLLNQYIDGPGLTVVIGAEHAAPGPAPVQPDCLHGGRRQRRRARSASSARRACTTRARSRSWTARRRRCRACCATPTRRQSLTRSALDDQRSA